MEGDLSNMNILFSGIYSYLTKEKNKSFFFIESLLDFILECFERI